MKISVSEQKKHLANEKKIIKKKMIKAVILLILFIAWDVNFWATNNGILTMFLAVAVCFVFIIYNTLFLFNDEKLKRSALKRITPHDEYNYIDYPLWRYVIDSIQMIVTGMAMGALVGGIIGGILDVGEAFGAFTLLFTGVAIYTVFQSDNYDSARLKYIKKIKKKEKEKDIEDGVIKADLETPVFYDEYQEEVMLNDPKLADLGSYPNPKDYLDGYLWSPVIDVYKQSVKKTVYLDNFALSEEVEYNVKDSLTFIDDDLEAISNVKSQLNPTDLTKTIMMIGSMGSGKTEAINSLINQDFYNRAIISDVKGDFVEKFYRPDEDIILNLFDERSYYWDIFSEMTFNPEVATEFVKNLVKSSVADKAEGDFWTNQAAKVITDSFLQVAFTSGDNSLKWHKLLAKLEQYTKNVGDDKTKSSIALTMDLSVEVFKLIAFRVENGAKPFTITEFFSREDKQKLFLLNNPAYSSKLTPFFTGFLGAVTAVTLGRADTKEDFTLTVLDEFYSLNFDKDTKTKILTMGRSKGMQLIIGTQFLDAKKERQLLESSRFAVMVFSLSDGDTVKRLSEMLGKVEYKESVLNTSTRDINTQGGNGWSGATPAGVTDILSSVSHRKNYSRSEQFKTKNILDQKKLQSMKQYHHITIIPTEGLLYLGYTELVDKEKVNKNFAPINMAGYYKFIYNDLQEDVNDATVETEEDEETLFVHWLNLRFPENDEAWEAYIKKHKIDNSLIDRVGEMFEEKKEVLEEARERFDNEQRYQLMDEFFTLDDKQKYHFVKKHKIIGAIIALFVLDGDYIAEQMEKFI